MVRTCPTWVLGTTLGSSGRAAGTKPSLQLLNTDIVKSQRNAKRPLFLITNTGEVEGKNHLE